MNREEALAKVREKVHDTDLVHHMLATAAIMEGLAGHFGEDREKWYLAGLLHDIDYEVTKDDPENHSLIAAEWLAQMDVDPEIIQAVRAHGGHQEIVPISLMDKGLWATDCLSGLITATAYVMPSRTLAEVQPKSVKKKFKDKAFARGAHREQIRTCEDFGLPLGDFIEIALKALQEVAPSLNLA